MKTDTKHTLTNSTKVQKLFENNLLSQLNTWRTELLNGDLSDVELSLRSCLQDLHNGVMECLLNEVGQSEELAERLGDFGTKFGAKDLKLREVRLQLGTGVCVHYKSYYVGRVERAKAVGKDAELACRHLSQVYWGCMKKSTPMYYDMVAHSSSICSSYEIACKVLEHQGIRAKTKRVRELSIAVGGIASDLGLSAQLDEGEDMSGKRVVVQVDGGRSRLRENKDSYTKKGYQRYAANWREPKLIAIHVLDEQGNVARSVSKPIYRAAVQDAKACMEDLVETLKLLKVDQALEVQFLADGAPFIWKRIRKAFRRAGVSAKKITYTLDYYHALQHLKKLSEFLPLTKEERNKQFEQWKSWLWDGLANSIVRQFKRLLKEAKCKLSDKMKKTLKYFKTHHDRMQYKRFKKAKLLCGSGLVESAIRRVINLRFKGPSTFWYLDNLNNMIVLRCAFLSKRWGNLMNAIQLRIKTGRTV